MTAAMGRDLVLVLRLNRLLDLKKIQFAVYLSNVFVHRCKQVRYIAVSYTHLTLPTNREV